MFHTSISCVIMRHTATLVQVFGPPLTSMQGNFNFSHSSTIPHKSCRELITIGVKCQRLSKKRNLHRTLDVAQEIGGLKEDMQSCRFMFLVSSAYHSPWRIQLISERILAEIQVLQLVSPLRIDIDTQAAQAGLIASQAAESSSVESDPEQSSTQAIQPSQTEQIDPQGAHTSVGRDISGYHRQAEGNIHTWRVIKVGIYVGFAAGFIALCMTPTGRAAATTSMTAIGTGLARMTCSRRLT